MAANDSHRNWLDFLVTMSIHESGVLNYGDSRAKVATLDRAGVPELLGEGLERGAKCTVDLNQVDHLAIAHLPLEQVRENFSVESTDRDAATRRSLAGRWLNSS